MDGKAITGYDLSKFGAVVSGVLLSSQFSQFYWLAWFFIGFGIYEGYTIYKGRCDLTLSAWVKTYFATDPAGRDDLSAWAKVRRVLLVMGLAWLAMHWLNGGTFF